MKTSRIVILLFLVAEGLILDGLLVERVLKTEPTLALEKIFHFKLLSIIATMSRLNLNFAYRLLDILFPKSVAPPVGVGFLARFFLSPFFFNLYSYKMKKIQIDSTG